MASTTRRPLLAASKISRDRVRNKNGEDLCEVKDLVIDIRAGRIVYAVLSFGGLLGIADKLIAVPWEAIETNSGTHQFVLDVDRDWLQDVPGFDKDYWPDMSDSEWQAEVHDRFQVAPYWC